MGDLTYDSLRIDGDDGSYVYGVAEAEDCGGAIKRDRMDLYFPTYEECIAFGWRTCTKGALICQLVRCFR